jgi:hypothetical protein
MKTAIQKSKDAILEYLEKAQQTEAKINKARETMIPEYAQKDEKYYRDKLAEARRETEAKIDAIIRDRSRGAEDWGKLDGAKLTADVQLLQGQGVTPDQWRDLVERYQDNYTMLDQLRKYGEARNAEASEKGHAEGDHFKAPAYDVTHIPGPDAKVQEWEQIRRQAAYFLNVADGTGYRSEFEKTFARNTADRAFEAWGADAPTPTKTGDEAARLSAAWGFVPKEA